MNRECSSECAAFVPTAGGNDKFGYHFTFPCVRLDAMYDITGALIKIHERLEESI